MAVLCGSLENSFLLLPTAALILAAMSHNSSLQWGHYMLHPCVNLRRMLQTPVLHSPDPLTYLYKMMKWKSPFSNLMMALKELKRNTKFFMLDHNGHSDTVSIDRLKPGQLDNLPTSATAPSPDLSIQPAVTQPPLTTTWSGWCVHWPKHLANVVPWLGHCGGSNVVELWTLWYCHHTMTSSLLLSHVLVTHTHTHLVLEILKRKERRVIFN